MLAFVKPCADKKIRESGGYCSNIMLEYLNTIIEVKRDSNFYGYSYSSKKNEKDAYNSRYKVWYWTENSLIILDTEEKIKKYTEIVKQLEEEKNNGYTDIQN